MNPFAVAATLNATSENNEEVKESEPPEAEPVWLGDLIRDGFYDKLVLIGFPYDEGARKASNRRGADFGPGKQTLFIKFGSFFLTFSFFGRNFIRLVQAIRERCGQRAQPRVWGRHCSWHPQNRRLWQYLD